VNGHGNGPAIGMPHDVMASTHPDDLKSGPL
jgi:hypothetical protein